MRLLYIFLGFFTFSLALPKNSLRRAHEVPPSEASVESAHSKDVAVTRGADENLEDRQIGELIVYGVTDLAFLAVAAGILAIVVTFYHDKRKREKFTVATVDASYQKWPAYGWVITYSPYATSFEGVQGKDWGHLHYELPISFGRTIGYEVFSVTSGTFIRYGDGGYENWAYKGNISGTDGPGGSILHFVSSTPVTGGGNVTVPGSSGNNIP